MADGRAEGEGTDGGGDRARPISLAPAPFSSNLVAFLLRPSSMSKYSAQFSSGRTREGGRGRVTHIVGTRESVRRLFTAKSAFEASHLKCTRQIYSVMSPRTTERVHNA